MTDRLEVAERVLDVVGEPVRKLGIELDVMRDAQGFLRAVAYQGARKRTAVWVGTGEASLRKALREALTDYIDELQTDALGAFDDALDKHDENQEDPPRMSQNTIPAENIAARPAETCERSDTPTDGGSA